MANNYWRTPKRVLEPAYALQRGDKGYVGAGRSFALDPFAARRGLSSHVVAEHFLYEDRRRANGGGAFAEPWKPLARLGLAWANPPYGRDILGACMRLQQAQAADGVWLVNLVPASTDVAWFHECWESAAQVCFYKGRIKFEDPTASREKKNSALFPNVSFHFPGDVNQEHRMERFDRIYSEHGIVVPCGELASAAGLLKVAS